MAVESVATAGPLVRELTPGPDPVDAFRRLAALPGCVFFDSAQRLAELGRYSYVAADPFDWITTPADGCDGLAQLARATEPFRLANIDEAPPFQGGAAGVFGYELGRSFERLPTPRFDEFRLPAMAVGLYDVVVAFDHFEQRCWVVSSGFPVFDEADRLRHAEQRLEALLRRIEDPAKLAPAIAPAGSLDAAQLAPQFDVEGRSGVTSDFSRDAYLVAVTRAVEYIHAGDAFQINLSQRLLQPGAESAVDAYLALRERNPAPFAGYFDFGVGQVCSASPERFLSVNGGTVETRPIKGTRKRSPNPDQDARIAEQLLGHPKDRAENVMIVDLLRNDLARVCTADSVRVPVLCGLESYEHVHHLVSVVTGRLRPECGPVDLLRASFPGGSITGAPKVRAMEIIAELEPTARGPYCGSLGFVGFNGASDSSILIRTQVRSQGWTQASVGGGIVADSDPEAEYEETWHKAAGLL